MLFAQCDGACANTDRKEMVPPPLNGVRCPWRGDMTAQDHRPNQRQNKVKANSGLRPKVGTLGAAGRGHLGRLASHFSRELLKVPSYDSILIGCGKSFMYEAAEAKTVFGFFCSKKCQPSHPLGGLGGC